MIDNSDQVGITEEAIADRGKGGLTVKDVWSGMGRNKDWRQMVSNWSHDINPNYYENNIFEPLGFYGSKTSYFFVVV